MTSADKEMIAVSATHAFHTMLNGKQLIDITEMTRA
jgi:hypothetical protein